ncbi:MAG: peptidylprolyl isomerase [Defluviitaleaceae bacterium]|nr:peptidylprolyl isomerase [Defluviitaleaceae bacterium]
MKKNAALLMVVSGILIFVLAACFQDEGAIFDQIAMPDIGEDIGIIRTNYGDIMVRFFPEHTPFAVANFMGLAHRGFYENTIFHFAQEGFAIRGGDPDPDGYIDPERPGNMSAFPGGVPFDDEFTESLRHIRGALSMVNQGFPNSNTSQFFIVQNNQLEEAFANNFRMILDDPNMRFSDGTRVWDYWSPQLLTHWLENGGAPQLDFNHTVFGQVFSGMDIVDAIARTETDENHRPLENIIIFTIEIVPWNGF